MLEAADTIIAYTDRGREAFDSDSALRDAILYQVVVLGEAAKAALSADPSLESALPEVEWSPIARMRDRVAHHYWATDRDASCGQPPRWRCRNSAEHSPRPWSAWASRSAVRGLPRGGSVVRGSGRSAEVDRLRIGVRSQPTPLTA